jgi:hypothetical protein
MAKYFQKPLYFNLFIFEFFKKFILLTLQSFKYLYIMLTYSVNILKFILNITTIIKLDNNNN